MLTTTQVEKLYKETHTLIVTNISTYKPKLDFTDSWSVVPNASGGFDVVVTTPTPTDPIPTSPQLINRITLLKHALETQGDSLPDYLVIDIQGMLDSEYVRQLEI